MMHIDDLNYQIMLHLSLDDLISLCNTNMYTHNICNNKQFWINKIHHDNLITPDNKLFDNVSGMDCYYACSIISKYLNKPKFTKKDTHYESLSAAISTVGRNKLISLILKYGNINIDTSFFRSAIGVTKDLQNSFHIGLKSRAKKTTFILDEQAFINFLFEGLSTKSIIIPALQEGMFGLHLKNM